MGVSALLVLVLSGIRRHVPESRMPTLQTVCDEGTSTQMFGGTRYETLPMQDCKQNTAEEQDGNILQVLSTGGREDGILH